MQKKREKSQKDNEKMEENDRSLIHLDLYEWESFLIQTKNNAKMITLQNPHKYHVRCKSD